MKFWQLFVVGLGLTVPSLVTAAETPPTAIYAPQSDIEKAAAAALDKHCARCHQDGKLVNRQKPAKALGNILQLDQIVSNPSLIQPGNAEGSRLIQQIVNMDMPYDVYQEGNLSYSSPTEEEVSALRNWIAGLKPQCDAKPVAFNDIISIMAADIGKLPEHRRADTRYITLTHLAATCTSKKDMDVYRQGAVKLLNSLSKYSDVLKLETVDPEKTILRVNLEDLGWEPEMWEELVSHYPYSLRPVNGQFDALAGTTLTKVPFIRGDWFAFTASRDPIYSKILSLPDTFKALQALLAVDVDINIANFKVKRAGVQKSGVSRNNRLVERHQIATGAFWTSYDFAGNSGRQNLFEYPLGPGGDYGFVHDGGESIFNLPNGFQAYYLNDANGKQLFKGPTSIVQDFSHRDMAVTNAISCMGCHNQGMRNITDEVGAQAAANKAFPVKIREEIKALYPPSSEMDAVIEADRKRFTDAMVKAGLDPQLTLNGVEMVTALSARYEWDLNLTQAAAEFGVSADEMKDAMIASGGMGKSIALRLDQGIVPRDQFEPVYGQVVERIIDAEFIPAKQVIGVAELKTYVAPVEPNGEVLRKIEPVASEDLKLSLYADKSSYMINDKPVFTVMSDRDCYLTLVNIDGAGVGTVIFPNKFQQDNKITGGKDFSFPAADSSFDFKFTEVGKESVIAVCDATGKAVAIEHAYAENAFTPLGETRSALRKIEVTERPKVADGGNMNIPPATSGVGRAAVILAVK
ncbi:DUF4384 domain-containing protein [Aestuariivirga sp.]|jgi:hypothetical protein|uniref:DUF4384 domain-containing protein n=1 Tax=Aestuariivirga sp. TaxID=2650926 RepID=UPI003784EF88